MAFNAGAVTGTMKMDNSKWSSGIKGGIKSIAALSAAVAVGAVVALNKASKAADIWQKSLANVSTLVDTNKVDMQQMSLALLNLDAKLGDTVELTDAMYQAFSAGASDMDEALQITTDSAKFATAALTDTTTAVDVLTTAQNAYGKDTITTAQASDIFFTTIKQGKITGEELATTIGKSIPLFASLNIPLEELGSGMAAMTKQGVNASEATTQLNGIVNSFLKPSDDMKAALEAQGYASGSALLETEGLSGALEFLETASGGSKDKLSKLLPSIEAVRGTLALTGTGGEEFTKILNEMEGASGATDEAFDKQRTTLEDMDTQIKKVELVVGNVALAFKDKLAKGVTTAATSMLTFLTSSSGMELVGNLVGTVAGTFATLKAIIVPLATVIKDVLFTAMDNIKRMLGDLGQKTGDGAIAFKILGIAATAVTSALRIISVSVTGVIENIGNLITAITASGKTIGTFFEFITFQKSWDEVKEQADIATRAFATFGQGVVENFGDTVKTVIEEVGTFGVNVEDAAITMEKAFVMASTSAKNQTQATWLAMITGTASAAEQLEDIQGESNDIIEEENEESNDDVEDDIIETNKNIWDSFKELFADTEFGWKGLYDNITQTISAGLNSISELTAQNRANEEAEQQLAYDNQLTSLEENLADQEAAQQTDYDTQLAAFTQQLEDKLITEESFNEQVAALDEVARANNLISQEQFDTQVALLDAAALEDKNALALKQFQTEKGMNIANAWMSAASSISGWWAQAPLLGPIAGPIWAGVMSAATTAMAVAQTSSIASQAFVPAREQGGMASGLTRINESGGEIVSLPDGSQVIPNDISRQIAGQSRSQTNVFNFNNPVIKDKQSMKELTNIISRELAKQSRRKAS